MNTSELTGAALDWAVAKCEDPTMADEMANAGMSFEGYRFSTDWAQGGPIIEREGIDLVKMGGKAWHAELRKVAHGPTPLIAAMRCYVASKLGDTIDVPEELTT